MNIGTCNMKAIREYRKKLDSIFEVVAMFDPTTIKERADVKEALYHWDADFFNRAYGWVKYYFPLDEIKEGLEGDCPDTQTLKRRLDYVFKEVGQFGNSIYFGLLPKDTSKLKLELTGIKGEEWAKKMCELVYELRTQVNRVTNEVEGYLHQLCKECDYNPQNMTPKPQQMTLRDRLPDQLKTNDAVTIFQRAVDAQLITINQEGLKWNDTKQLLAYFATKVSGKFSLTTRLDKDGNKTTDWKTFETLFKEKGVKGAKYNWMRLNTKFEPTGFKKVDALF